MLRRNLIVGGSVFAFGVFGILGYRAWRRSGASSPAQAHPAAVISGRADTDSAAQPRISDIDIAEHIRLYFESNYGPCNLREEEIRQLGFLYKNSRTTPESNARIAANPEAIIDLEIKRALSRLQSLRLFEEGSARAHNVLTAQQPADDKLTWDNFKFFSDLIKRCNNGLYFTLRASCFLAWSDRAEALFMRACPGVDAPVDSEKFLTATVTLCPEIYPVCEVLLPHLREMMQFMYLPDTHARHMLYTEGGENMFTELKNRIRSRTLTREQFNLWICRWILSIAGFRGHENPAGSIYLTNKTARHLRLLINELNILFTNPNHDVLTAYLGKRGAELKLTSKYLIHIGALMRLSKMEEGKELQHWFDSLNAGRRQALEDEYITSIKSMTVTPTYEPAVLDTLRALGCGITEALEIYSSIRSKALEQYSDAIRSGIVTQTTPLSFKTAAHKDNLSPLVQEYKTNGTIEFTVSFAANGSFALNLMKRRLLAAAK